MNERESQGDPAQETSVEPTTSQPATNFDGMLTGDWFGAREKLANAGVSIGSTLILEGFDNFMGGIKTGVLGSTTFDLNATLDLQKLVNISGGEIYCNLEDHAFTNPTTVLVGDLQVFDKYNAAPYLQIFELWYQQTLFNGALRVKVGKVDANTEFDVIDNGLAFIGSSTQVTPTIFLMPTTPDPQPSVNVFFTPQGGCFASFGAYYANQSERFGDFVDYPSSTQPTRYGAFFIGETGLKWDYLPGLSYSGNFKIGAWGQTGTFTRFDGNAQKGTGGGYAMFNQTLYQPPGESASGRGVRMFLTYGGTQTQISAMDEQAGAGVTLTGPVQSRSQDVIGISAQYAQISRAANLVYPFELAVEGFYQVQATGWMQIQPDLQYILHPGGRYPDALVLTLRCTMQF